MTANTEEALEMPMTEEQVKKEKESPELKDELTEDELKGVDGGDNGGDRNHFVMYGYSKKMKE